MGFTRVQAAGATSATASLSFAFAGSTSSGNLLVCFWSGHETSNGSVTLSDNVNGAWTLGSEITAITGSGKHAAWFWVLSSGTGTLTLTFGGLSAGSQFAQAAEYSWGGSAGTLDSPFQTTATSGSATTTSTVTSGTPTTGGDLWLCGTVTGSEGTITFTANSPFTSLVLDGASNTAGQANGTATLAIEEDLSGTSSAVTATMGLGATVQNWGTIVIGFTPVGVGPRFPLGLRVSNRNVGPRVLRYRYRLPQQQLLADAAPLISTSSASILRVTARTPIRRVEPLIISAPSYNSGGFKPVVTAGSRSPRSFAAGIRSRLVTVPAVNPKATVVIGLQKKHSLRAISRVITASPYNSGGFDPISTTVSKRTKSTRAQSRLIVSGVNPSGTTVIATQRGRIQRAKSRVLTAPIFNSGGSTPTTTHARQLGHPLRSISRIVVSIAQPPVRKITTGRQQANPALRRTQSHIVFASLSLISLPSSLTKATRYTKSLFRARPRFTAVSENPVGQPAEVTVGKRQTPPIRLHSRIVTATIPIVISLPAVLLIAQPRRKRSLRFRSRPTFAPVPVAGVASTLISGVKRLPPERPASRIIPQVSSPILPAVTYGEKWRLPLRVRAHSSLIIAPTSQPSGTLPTKTQGTQRINRSRPGSRLIVSARFNSGGLSPVRTHGVNRTNRSRPASRLAIAPSFNSGGFTAEQTTGVKRLPPLHRAPQRFTPVFNSSGIFPTITLGKQKTKPRQRKPVVFTPSYNSGGIAARLSSGYKRNPYPLRSHSKPVIAARFNSGGSAPTRVRGYRRNPYPLRSLTRVPRTTGFLTVVGVATKVFVAPTRSLNFVAPLRPLIGIAPVRSLLFIKIEP